MDKKNTMLLTVIAVATLLVAVVGATFAYYSVSAGGSSSTVVTATTGEAPGVVTLTEGDGPLYLNMPTTSMLKDAVGTYYALTTDTAATKSATAINHTLANFKIAGGTDGTIYDCSFDVVIKGTDLDEDLEAVDGKVTLIAGDDITLDDTEVTLAELFAAGTNGVTISGGYDRTGDGQTTVTGNVTFVNTDDADNTQNDLAEMNAKIYIDFNEFECNYSD